VGRDSAEIQQHLRYIYANIYVDFVVKNPLYRINSGYLFFVHAISSINRLFIVCGCIF
jgi:hypothetical protein